MDHTSTTVKTCSALQNLSTIIFWGSLWGIIEATLGSIIRGTGLPYMGLLLFFLAMPCLAIAYRYTGLLMSSVYIAMVAATIRCVNIPLVGGSRALLSSILIILIEGVAMSAFITIARLKPLPGGRTVIFKPLTSTIMLTVSIMLTIAL